MRPVTALGRSGADDGAFCAKRKILRIVTVYFFHLSIKGISALQRNKQGSEQEK
jgi:hypothetical protein